MSDPDICGTCGLFIRGSDVTGDACPGHDNPEIAPNGVPYRDMWAGGVGPRLRADQSIGNPGTLPRGAYSNSDTPRTDASAFWVKSPTDHEMQEEVVVSHFARQIERENAELADQVMRWFRAASPYATPGSLEEGLKKLEQAACPTPKGCSLFGCKDAAPIDSTVKPSAWD